MSDTGAEARRRVKRELRLERDDAAPIAADAGFAGVGRYGVRSKDEPLEVVMARVSGPDFEREWAELVSAQTSLS